jgi:hypothetical protein
MKISYCITSLGRFNQISKTLIPNLRANLRDQDKVEYILVDFNRPDDLQLENFVKKNCSGELKSGYLKYYRTDKQPYWHASTCKNTSHRLASYDILFNLDGDNYIEEGHAIEVLKAHKKGIDEGINLIVHDWSGNYRDGTYGRVAILRKHFTEIGGFDEEFKAHGYEETDCMERLKIYLNCKVIRLSRRYCGGKLPKAIMNSKNGNEQHWDPEAKKMTWDQINNYNQNVSLRKISTRNLIANRNKPMIGVECNRITV